MNSKQRRQQKRKYVREVKERMEEDIFNGKFTSWQFIDNSGYVDLLFVGDYKGKEVIWNACFTTTKGDYFETIDGMATDEAYDKFPLPDDYDPFKTEPIEGSKMRTCIFNDDEHTKQRRRWNGERTIELLNDNDVEFYTYDVDIDESYKHGIGLHIRVDELALNVDDCNKIIDDFLRDGQSCYDHCKERFNPTADELGVELNEDNWFVTWKTPWSHNIVALNI